MSAIKKIPLQQRSKFKLAFEPNQPGPQEYKLYLMCDSYMGCDQEYVFSLQVQRGEGFEDQAMAEAEPARRAEAAGAAANAGEGEAQANGQKAAEEEGSDEDDEEDEEKKATGNEAKRAKKEEA